MLKRISLTLMLLVVASACSKNETSKPADTPPNGSSQVGSANADASEVTVATIDELMAKLDNQPGKLFVVQLWATW